ncbi:50S ribosomal protein L3 [Coxiella endosymbiont of Amblyomma americanum]|uniref:50S ribosomal protein L3 n=1 Tax=Coxiella endosymbiont of Amblyomma americanum TaxID=325775 RepID=UPI00057EDA81|nr:50S ribosomal protein L3 [Coxiella endosymbiont of Amblyomma americanum]AJC50423.1 50S ribosomal protein L3 [Coxiella endosymbiont of Amblyomma americanum]AUJ58763.1 50S ribosomal protein L3 [Coxiella-like endosymbiont of Amblyomma americanum]
MSIGLIGRKCGMTRLFMDVGVVIPVTVIETFSNRITQIKTVSVDGYCAIQIAACGKKPFVRLSKAIVGHYAKSGVEAGKTMHEFRVTSDELVKAKLGDEIEVSIFKEGQIVDVRGLTRGKGFAGTVKRHNFRTQDATHGNSLSHRVPGSMGQCQTPGRVWKGKKMSGHMGNVYCTIQNQEIVKVDVKRQLLLIKGAVPGAPGKEVIVTQSIKKGKKR